MKQSNMSPTLGPGIFAYVPVTSWSLVLNWLVFYEFISGILGVLIKLILTTNLLQTNLSVSTNVVKRYL